MSGKTLEKILFVKNDLGLHTRPATQIVALIQDFKSEIYFTHEKETINAKSILSILMLAAKKGSQIAVKVCGEDAEEAMITLETCFDECFGERSSDAE